MQEDNQVVFEECPELQPQSMEVLPLVGLRRFVWYARVTVQNDFLASDATCPH